MSIEAFRPRGPINVLIVDDEAEVRAAYRTALGLERGEDATRLETLRSELFADERPQKAAGASCGFTVDEASSAVEAVKRVTLSIAGGAPYDVIFLDVRMPPGHDGIWAAERIRAVDPDVEIVVCTAYSDVDPDLFGERVPPTEKLFYLQKPFHLHEVRQMAHALGRKRAAEARVLQLAYYDSLTGLPNRERIRAATATAIDQAREQGSRLALLYLDLDGFKRINDALGHAVGDELLQETASRLRSLVRADDTLIANSFEQDRNGSVGRLGGDEFLLVLRSISKVEDVSRIAERLQRELSSPIALDLCEVLTTASVGIAMYPDDGQDADMLLRNADLAMYYAKRRGRGSYAFYHESMNATSLRRLTLENLLRRALDRNEISLRYQPQIDLSGGDLCGMEALMRWDCPKVGAVSPDEFIPVAEESGLILSLGDWALREACRQAADWRTAGLALRRISVNVSPMQFHRPGLPDIVRGVLRDTGLPPEYLELEMTESMLMHDEESSRDTLRQLKALGVQVAIDDFGTGYSSLSRLRQFRVDRIKIDKSFIAGIASRGDDADVAAAIINLGKTLGLEVVAEGVESFEQVRFLQQRMCEQAQGFLVAQPLTSSDARAFLGRFDDSTIVRRVRNVGQQVLPPAAAND